MPVEIPNGKTRARLDGLAEEIEVAKAEKKVAPKQENRVQRYFRETIGELRKVTWPTREEAINLTIIVLIVVAVMSVFLGVLDLVYSRFFGVLFGL